MSVRGIVCVSACVRVYLYVLVLVLSVSISVRVYVRICVRVFGRVRREDIINMRVCARVRTGEYGDLDMPLGESEGRQLQIHTSVRA